MLKSRKLSYLLCFWLAAAGSSSAQPTPSQPPSGRPAERTRKVSHFSVEGNTLLEPALLRRLASRYEGRELTLAQMKQLAQT